ncbi:MAG: substrate-binding domain-containing protein [Protaetiibacter sp.]
MIHSTRRAAVLALVSTGAVVALAGCSADAEPSESGSATTSDYTIAAVFPNTSDPFWQTITCGAAAEATELGVDLQQFNTTSTDTNTIASNFQSASLIGADAMIVNPFTNNQFIAQYQQLMSEGVPVVTSNGTDPQAEYLNIYSDGETAGFADQVADLIPDGAGSMVFMGGAPGIAPLETRTNPFYEAVQEMRSDLTVLPIEYSGFDTNQATTDISSLIIANPDLKLIIASNGPDGVAAAAAVKQAGMSGEIAVIAFDAIPGQVDALRDGTISALIAQDPYEIGAQSVKELVDYLDAHPDGGAVEPSGSKTIPSFLLTAENVDDPDNAKYLYQTQC